MDPNSAVLLLTCPDRPGLVARVAGFVHERGGNIVEADQHTDRSANLFLQRIELTLPGGTAPGTWNGFGRALRGLGDELGLTVELHRPGSRARVALLVSRWGHCLYDLLARVELGELPCEVVFVASNHEDHRVAAERFDVPFHHLPVDPADPASKPAQEEALAALVEDGDVDLVVLARYMQVLSDGFCSRFENRIVNIHHSFLPAFVGAQPYRKAWERGVKLIGATAHYATADLDQGPIICQDVTPVSHRDDVAAFTRRGRDLESTTLARAVLLHLEHRVIAYANRTVVFE